MSGLKDRLNRPVTMKELLIAVVLTCAAAVGLSGLSFGRQDQELIDVMRRLDNDLRAFQSTVGNVSVNVGSPSEQELTDQRVRDILRAEGKL